MIKSKILLAVCAISTATAMTIGFTACNNNNNTDDGGLTASEAATKIAGFTSSPTTIDATFKQTYKLEVNSDNASMKNYEKDIDDTVTIQVDYTSGNVYYYGKKATKDGSVTEQLVVKEDDTYYWLTTTTVKTALDDEAAALAKINELMTSISKETTGYVDGNAFVYSSDWVHTYILLGSGTITGTESSYFTYNYEETESGGLNVSMDMKYVGYYGDAGTFEFGTDDTHTGSVATVETDGNGFITSFSQTLSNHLEMAIVNPAVPLDLSGTRSLSATYNGTLTKKTTIEQDLTPGTITINSVENATVEAYDFEKDNYATLATPSDTVSAGNYVVVKVTCDEGYEVYSVKVNGEDTQLMGTYYGYMTPAEAGATYTVTVVVVAEGEEAPTTGTIVVSDVANATVETYNFKKDDYSTLSTPSTTVDVGNFVAVKVTCVDGYVVDTVTVNGQATIEIKGYYCLMSAATAGTVYNVEVTVKETPGTIVVPDVENATVETYNFKSGDYSTLTTPSTTVDVGNFVAVKVTCVDGYVVDTVTVNGQATIEIKGYYCLMSAATSGTVYTVTVTVKAV